ncbi:hypothetical protein PUNSTDRAFT_127629 [Punctularia strigosozonata HHB-11173 SS5]|uniref:uncharacterized protein n=1 Tax=Punctularia strigosozonata (strain HHB-11173) TaxID=741275 RepID=UPI0004417035|nr:uncharacterized protein PUNSTDRAFT_127629 [Punctularia strigosozonata HHB-11173 SS5]EIN06295.1 hypothetical protein PUNSTDRAFT_127629 [Punctularia strigosozonata HHB-11173 SS5]
MGYMSLHDTELSSSTSAASRPLRYHKFHQPTSTLTICLCVLDRSSIIPFVTGFYLYTLHTTNVNDSKSAVMLIQVAAPTYQFLSQPPAQKKRPAPNQPLPSPPQGKAPSPTYHNVCPQPTPMQPLLRRRRSNTTSAISAWAAAVQPGSPAPCSPPIRRPSTHRRPSTSRGRRSSITSQRVPSGSFLSLTPTSAQISLTPGKTPSTAEGFNFLICAGYSAAFLRIPVPPTPATAAIPSSNGADGFKDIPIPPIPASPAKSKGMRLRSLSLFKRGRSKSVMGATSGSGPTPPLSPALATSKTSSGTTKSQRSASIAAKKRRKYPKLPAPLPLTLAQEAELAQLLDGGSTRTNVQRVMRDKAVANGTAEGVAVATKDENGVWWEDAEEREEFVHLLADKDKDTSPGAQWVEFFFAGAGATSPSTGVVSATTASSLDPRCLVLPATDDLALFGFAPFDSVVTSQSGGNKSVLAIPARPRRAAEHLRRPALLHDAFVALPSSPRSPKAPRSPKSSSPRYPHAFSRRVRRRPTPLKLSPPSPAVKRAVNGQGQPTADARKGFLEDSFEPESVPMTAPLPVAAAQQTDAVTAARVVSRKPSMWKLLRKVKT